MQQLSFNEFHTLLKRAARGAGLEWGYAEELAYSACWLASNSNVLFDKNQHKDNQLIAEYVLAFLLDYQRNTADYKNPNANSLNQGLFVVEQPNTNSKLNPLVIATLINDLAMFDSTDSISIENIAFPLLIIPYCQQCVTVGMVEELLLVFQSNIQLQTNKQESISDLTKTEQQQRVNISGVTKNHLEQLLLTMCVAESEASLKDAG